MQNTLKTLGLAILAAAAATEILIKEAAKRHTDGKGGSDHARS